MMIGFGDRSRTQQEVCDLFNEINPNRPPLSQSTVSKIEMKFRELGNVRDRPRRGRHEIEENVQIDILVAVQENPKTASNILALDNNVSRNTVLNILHKNNYHPYKVRLIQELSEDDFDRRNQYCDEMMNICHRDPLFVTRVIYSDEATFYLNGDVNRQNCRYWAPENPHWAREVHTQYPQKLNVWAGIVGTQVLGPYFFEGSLTGDRYLEFLQFDLVPALAILFPNPQDPDLPNENIWFQQDGAPPHYSANVRAFLNDVFQGKWIGRRGPMEWPARSPDLTPLDFFLWGYLKAKVYKNKPRNLENLKEKIRHEIRLISPEVIRNVQRETVTRLGHCQVVNGHQFEHLL